MNSGLVTVVLPIYNVEKYLEHSIKSIVSQTYSNLEILLIDDGSTDSSPAICDEWAKRDERIRVIHKHNQGQGIARNLGMDNATGEYICFFDSDDYIHESTIEKAYKLATENQSDLVVFGLNSVDNDLIVSESFVPAYPKRTYCGDEVRTDFFPEYLAPDPNGDGNCKFYMSSCPMLYSRRLIESLNWRYVSEREIISEDVYSLISLFRHVNRVSVLAEALYYYRRNDASFSHIYRADRYEKVRRFYVESKKLCEELEYNDEVIHRLSKPYLGYTIACLKQECTLKRSCSDTYSAVKKIVDDDVLQSVLIANKKDKSGMMRKVLFFSIRHKLYGLCVLLLAGKQLISMRNK